MLTVLNEIVAKLAKLRREIIEPKSGGGGGKGEGFDVARTGDARVGFVGFPSVGKSTLLSNLAGVYSEVAAYEFTTLTTVPGVIRYKVNLVLIEAVKHFMFREPKFNFLIYLGLSKEQKMEKVGENKSLR